MPSLGKYEGRDLWVVFSGSPETNTPATRVLGPYHRVRFSRFAIWASRKDVEDGDPFCIATQQKDGVCWELHGLEDPPWGNADVIAPDFTTTAREIEADTDWIRPSPKPDQER